MRSGTKSVDAIVRERLSQWPQHPPGIDDQLGVSNAWLRGRPDGKMTTDPYLKVPGTDRYRTFPDGLWLNFGGTPVDPFVDIFAVEACSCLTNLLDKRSRFSPSTHSLLAVCPYEWMRRPISDTEPTPRWKATGILYGEPVRDTVFPIRDMRVLYGLTEEQYNLFAWHQAPHAHEYFVPMEALMAEDGHRAPALQALVARASVGANFLKPPKSPDQPLPARRPRSVPGELSAAMQASDTRPSGRFPALMPVERRLPTQPAQAASRTTSRTWVP